MNARRPKKGADGAAPAVRSAVTESLLMKTTLTQPLYRSAQGENEEAQKEEKGRKKFNYRLLIACVVSGAAAAIFGGFLADKSMSVAEGWYSYYAYLINEQGAVPYVDFPLLFPPLYVYLIALFTRIFGYGFMALRVLGVLIYVLLSVFACLIFYKVFGNEFIAAAAGIFVFSYLQSEIVQISYDYIRFMDLSVYISIFFGLCHLKRAARCAHMPATSLYANAYVFPTALFAVFASMFKQSSGLIFLVFVAALLAFFCLIGKNKKQAAFALVWYAAVAVAAYGVQFIAMAIQGNLDAYLHYNFGSSVSAKGGIFTILFGQLLNNLPNLANVLAVSLLFIVVLGLEIWLSKIFRDRAKEDLFSVILLSVFGAGLCAVVVCCFLVPAFGKSLSVLYPNSFMYWAFLSTFFICVATFIVIVARKTSFVFGADGDEFSKKYFFVSGCAAVLAYAVTTSGGFSQGEVALCAGVMLGSLAYFAKFMWKEILCTFLAIIFVFYTAVFFSFKIQTVYSWWEMVVGTYWEQTEEITDIDYLNGIKVSPQYYEMYHNVTDAVETYTESDDHIFVFPHAPIFYLLTHRDTNTYTKIQWFDVASDEEIVADIDVLREDPPAAIVFVHIPDSTIEGHENAFRGGEASGLRIMQDFLTQFTEESYTEVSSDDIGGEYYISVHILNGKMPAA